MKKQLLRFVTAIAVTMLLLLGNIPGAQAWNQGGGGGGGWHNVGGGNGGWHGQMGGGGGGMPGGWHGRWGQGQMAGPGMQYGYGNRYPMPYAYNQMGNFGPYNQGMNYGPGGMGPNGSWNNQGMQFPGYGPTFNPGNGAYNYGNTGFGNNGYGGLCIINCGNPAPPPFNVPTQALVANGIISPFMYYQLQAGGIDPGMTRVIPQNNPAYPPGFDIGGIRMSW